MSQRFPLIRVSEATKAALDGLAADLLLQAEYGRDVEIRERDGGVSYDTVVTELIRRVRSHRDRARKAKAAKRSGKGVAQTDG
jgi:hypothetical protein